MTMSQECMPFFRKEGTITSEDFSVMYQLLRESSYNSYFTKHCFRSYNANSKPQCTKKKIVKSSTSIRNMKNFFTNTTITFLQSANAIKRNQTFLKQNKKIEYYTSDAYMITSSQQRTLQNSSDINRTAKKARLLFLRTNHTKFDPSNRDNVN